MKYQLHSETSKQAAIDAMETSATKRSQVYRCIRDSCGATDDEVQVSLQMNPSTQRPRRIELMESGLVTDSGQKRKTRGNKLAVVWEVL